MRRIKQLGTFNLEQLTKELRTAYPARGNEVGCKSFDGGLLLIVPDDAQDTDIDIVIAAHNPTTRTSRQSKEDTENADIDAFLALEFNPTNAAHLTLLYKVLKSIVANR